MKVKKEGKAKVLSKEEFYKVLNSLKKTRYEARNKAMLALSFGCGLRVGEISKLLLLDIISLGILKSEILLHARITKNKHPRIIYLEDSETKSYLLEYCRSFKNIEDDFEPAFKSQKGHAFSPNALQYLFHKMYKDAGITGASSHSGRRTFCTNLIEAGADIGLVKTAMGHSNVNTTLGYYEHNPERLKSFLRKGIIK